MPGECAAFPNDYFSLHRVVTLGQPLGPEGELGKAIESLAAGIFSAVDEGKKPALSAGGAKAVLSHA